MKRHRPLPHLLLLPVLLVLVSGCGDSSPTEPPPPVQVSVSPSSASLDQGATASFTATVTNSENTGVTWSTTAGTLSGQGNTVTLTAPESAGQVTVTATSVADGTRSGSATVTVAQVAVALQAPGAPVPRHGTTTVTAAVTGTVQTGVAWQSTCEGIATEGSTATWTAPGVPGACEVTATSTADPSRSATAELSVDPDFVVNASDDQDDGRCDPAHCSLREALVLGLAELDGGADELRIRFASALDGATLTLGSALPTLHGRVTIVGPGPDALTVDANAATDQNRRVFYIVDGQVTLEGMTLSGGSTEALPPALRRGGAIFAISGSDVHLRDMVVRGNHARAGGGGVAAAFGSSLHIEDSRILENEASTGGGVSINEGSLVLENSEVRGNESTGFGGGVYADNAEITVRESEIRENLSRSSGGGIVVTTSSTGTIKDSLVEDNRTESGAGGGISVSTQSSVVLEGVTVQGNESGLGGGGIAVTASSLVMTESLVIGNHSNAVGGGGMLFSESEGTLSLSRIEENLAEVGGGGGVGLIFNSNVTMEAMEVLGNETLGTSGGGVSLGSSSELTWSGGVLRANRAASQGGGVYVAFAQASLHDLDVADNEVGSFGGGIAVLGASTVLLERLTVRGNEGGIGGGGLSLSVTQGDVLVRNVTLSGNSALNGAAVRFAASALLEHVTIVGNLSSPTDPSPGFGGALHVFGAATQARLRHVVMDGNRTDGEPRGCAVQDGGATIVSEGGNVVEDQACSAWLTHASDRLGVDPGVEAVLGNHGGPTLTHALVAGSQAIGAGNPATCAATDQRGYLRNEGCDAGAVQANGTAPAGR